MPIAMSKPKLLALFCWFFGSLSDTKEMKMILSIPKIISIKVKVTIEIHASGEVKVAKNSFIIDSFEGAKIEDCKESA